MSERNRRRTRNVLQDPGVQYRYGLYFFGFAAAAAAVNQLVMLTSFRSILSTTLMKTNVDPLDLALIVGGPLHVLGVRTTVTFCALGLLCMAFGVYITHRFVGPEVSLRRQIAALKEGDYSATSNLRTHDELQALSADLNELAIALRERHGDAVGGAASAPEVARVAEHAAVPASATAEVAA